MSADSVIPFAFETLPVRGALIHLGRSWRRMQRDHDYSPLLAETLGHTAAATGLIAQSLKFDGAITLQIQGSGALQILVMQCTSAHEMRGMAVMQEDAGAQHFTDLAKGARCAITVDSGDRPYQGIVAMDGESLSASLEHYFQRSVQVPSHIALVANDAVAGGILLQQMPGQPIDPDDWNRLRFLVATLSTADFAGDAGMDLLARLFAEDDVRAYEPRPVRFRCRCSASKTEDVLRMIGEAEARAALAEQDDIEIVCEFCGRRRSYDAVDVERVFAAKPVTPGPDSLH